MEEEIGDDFGDLYADVEVQASAAINGLPEFTRLYLETEKPEDEDWNSTEHPNTNAGFDSAPNNVPPTRSFEGCTDEKVLGSEMNGEKDLAVNMDSDSEDDLNIVLNDEDCKLFSGAGCASVENGDGGCEEVEDWDKNFGVTEDTNSSQSRNRGNQLGDGLELSSNGHGNDERGNGFKGNYNSQYKHKRQIFPSKMKANGYAGMTSFSSILARGHWDDNGCNQRNGSSSGQIAHIHCTSSSLKAPSGYGFSLPWYRTILDVNIDTFEEKPWRYDRVDVTDFFNFGFNEDSWKRYCNSLEQFRQQTSMQARIPVYESSKLVQAYGAGSEHEKSVQEDTNEEFTHDEFGRILCPLSKFTDRGVRQLELPRGKAIQVKGSIAERQPSLVRRSHDRDSDVVIQITVQDSSEDSYGSGKESLDRIDGNVHEASENGDLNAEDNRDIPSSGNVSGDDLSVESLEGNTKRFERPLVLKRCALSTTSSNPKSSDSANHGNARISDVDGHHCEKVNAHSSRRIAEAMEQLNNAEEELGQNTCRADQCIMETELSTENQNQHRPTSYSGSDSEASRDGINVDSEVHNPLRKSSRNSGIELLASVSSDHSLSRSSKDNGSKARSGDSQDTSRNSSRIRDEQKCGKRRFPNGSELKRHTDDHGDEAFPMSDTAGSHDRDLSSVDFSRGKYGPRDFGYCNRQNYSYKEETELSFCHVVNRFADDHTRTVYRKYPNRKSYQNLRDEVDPYIRKKWDERQSFHEQRSARVDNEDLDRDLYHCGKGLSNRDMCRFPYRESRQLGSKYSSHTAIERDTRWRRKSEDFQFRKKTDNDGSLLDYKNEDDFMREKFERSSSFTDRERGFLDKKHERRLSCIGREGKISGRKNRYGDNSPLGLDSSWSTENEDEYWEYKNYQSLSSQPYRESDNGCLLDYKNEDFMQEKIGRSGSSTDRERGFLDKKNERRVSRIGREVKISGRRNRYWDNSPLDLDSSWSTEIEDEYWEYTNYQSLSSQAYRESDTVDGGRLHDISPRNDWHDSRFSERYGRHRRQMRVEQCRDNGWVGSNNGADDAKGCTIYTDDQVHLGGRYSDSYKVPDWTEDPLLLRHQGHELYGVESSCSYERISRHSSTRAKRGSGHDRKFTDDVQLEQREDQMMRKRNSSNCIGRSPNINTSDKHEQTVLRCRDSVDLVVGEGKFSGRGSKGGSFACNGRFKSMDLKIVKEQANSKDFNESRRGKSVQPDIPEVESNRNNVKWLDKFPVTEHNEDLDLEEGQIIAEEPEEELGEKKQVSEDAALNLNTKRIFRSENTSNGNKVVGGYDNQRILESLVKMEKRGERFKEPVTLEKKPEKCPKPQVDLIVDTAEIKQQRPARKRRWSGS